MPEIRRNITVYYLFNFFFYAIVFTPVFVLYEQSRGLTLTQITLTASVYYLFFFFLEIPTGIFADRFGRKNALIIGAVLMMCGALVCIFAQTFLHFIIAELLFSTAVAFVSGADTALIYDSLAAAGKTGEYLSVAGKGHTMNLLSRFFSFILCAYLTKIGLIYPYIATLALVTVSALIALLFREGEIAKPLATSKIILSAGIKQILANDALKAIFIFNALLFTLSRLGAIILYQPYFTELGVDAGYLGLIYAGLNLVSAFSARFVTRIKNLLNPSILFYSLPLTFTLSFGIFGLGKLPLSLIFLAVPAFAFGLQAPIIYQIVNRAIPESYNRATILSLQSLTARISLALIAPLTGLSLDHLGIVATLKILFLIFTLFSVIILKIYRKHIHL